MTDFLSVDTSVALNIHLHHARYIRHTFLCVPSTTSLLVTIIGASIYHNYIFSCFLCLVVFFSLVVFSSDKALWQVPEKCTGSDALWRFAPCNSYIPHFNSTNYLALNVRSFSTRIKCQTFSVAMVERNSHFSVSAPWLLEAFCGELEAREQCLAIGITSQEPVNAKKSRIKQTRNQSHQLLQQWCPPRMPQLIPSVKVRIQLQAAALSLTSACEREFYQTTVAALSV